MIMKGFLIMGSILFLNKNQDLELKNKKNGSNIDRQNQDTPSKD